MEYYQTLRDVSLVFHDLEPQRWPTEFTSHVTWYPIATPTPYHKLLNIIIIEFFNFRLDTCKLEHD